jgi:hypothetical protein
MDEQVSHELVGVILDTFPDQQDKVSMLIKLLPKIFPYIPIEDFFKFASSCKIEALVQQSQLFKEYFNLPTTHTMHIKAYLKFLNPFQTGLFRSTHLLSLLESHLHKIPKPDWEDLPDVFDCFKYETESVMKILLPVLEGGPTHYLLLSIIRAHSENTKKLELLKHLCAKQRMPLIRNSAMFKRYVDCFEAKAAKPMDTLIKIDAIMVLVKVFKTEQANQPITPGGPLMTNSEQDPVQQNLIELAQKIRSDEKKANCISYTVRVEGQMAVSYNIDWSTNKDKKAIVIERSFDKIIFYKDGSYDVQIKDVI